MATIAAVAAMLCLSGCGDRDDPGWGRTDVLPPVGDWYERLPPCEAGATDGRIDLSRGCADGACADMDYAQVNAALGEEAICDDPYAGEIYCEWSAGISAFFLDEDDDGLPDAGDAALLIFVDPPYDGHTDAGLGLGVSLRCFVDQLGPPDSVNLEPVAGDYAPGSLFWDRPFVAVADYLPSGIPNGYADSIALGGSL